MDDDKAAHVELTHRVKQLHLIKIGGISKRVLDLSQSECTTLSELYFNIHGGTLPQRALKQLGRACI